MIKRAITTLCAVLLAGNAGLAQNPNSGPAFSPVSTPIEDATKEALRRQAMTILAQQELDSAKSELQRGDQERAAAHYQRAKNLMDQVGPASVAEDYKVAVEGLTRVRLRTAEQALEAGDLDRAEEDLATVLAAAPGNESALALNATLKARQKKEQGRRPSRDAVAQLPLERQKQVETATMMQDAKLYYEAGRLDLAESKIRMVLDREPGYKPAYYYLDIIMNERLLQQGARRESDSKLKILQVAEEWTPKLGIDLPVPNPYSRTNLIHTGKGRQAIYSKLHRIRLNELTYDGLPLGEVLKALSTEAKKRDPEQLGVNFMISPNADPLDAGPPPIDPNTGLPLPEAFEDLPDLSGTTITIKPPLTDITLYQALDAVVKSADRPVKYSVEEYAVMFTLKAPETPALHVRWYKLDPNTFVQGLQGVTTFDFGGGGGGFGGGGGGGGGFGGGGRGGGGGFGGGGGRGGGGGGFGGGGGGFGGSGGGNQGGFGGGGSEYVGVSLAGGGNRGNNRFGGQGGQGGQGNQQGAGGNNNNTGSGIDYLTSVTPTMQVIDVVRSFFTQAGVNLDTPKGVFFNDRRGMLMVRATLEDLDIIEQAIQMLNMSPPQLTIEAKFAEVTQDDTKAIGFDWLWGNTLLNKGGIGVQGGTAPSYGLPDPITGVSPAASAANPNGFFPGPGGAGFLFPAATDNILTSGLNQEAPALATITGILTDPQFRVVIRALEQREGVDLLSAPKITTLSSRQAQIKVVDIRYIVTDLGINQTSSGGGGGVGAGGFPSTGGGGGVVGSAIQPISTPVEVGPVLDVVPYVSADGYTVQMTLIPTIKEFVGYDLDSAQLFQAQAQSVGGAAAANPLTTTTPLPIFRLRQVVTSAVVWDGQTIVLGGLISENVTKRKDKVPFLGDLPWVGKLFRSESSSTMKKNLLIFVTPTIIDPAGNRVHSEEELPFAQNLVPPQTPLEE